MRIFSGIQPSGIIHIGNYLGAIKNWIALQKKYDCIYCIVDYHAITVPYDPKRLQKRILDLTKIYLASGINPKKSIIFVQSHVPEHTELTWILNTIIPISELKRMTQYKDKAKKQGKAVGAGLLNYPVLMAADILLYKTEGVPVGEDQVQHVELARKIARKFNNTFGKTFPLPEVLLQKSGARIMSLINPQDKMSKSDAANSYISLVDSPKTIRKKIQSAVTDSGKEIKVSPKKPAISNLITIYQLFSNLSVKQIEGRYKGRGYAEFKKDLGEVVVGALELLQKKYKKLDDSSIRRSLTDGAKRASQIAKKTMEEVRKKIGVR